MFLHKAKDGGLFSEVLFLLIITFVSALIWFRMKIIFIIITIILSPILIVGSYLLWFYLLNDEGIGFLIIYLLIVLIYKFIIYSMFRISLKEVTTTVIH
jgi:hypothetical protein